MPFKDPAVCKAYHKKYSSDWEKKNKRWLTSEYREKRKNRYKSGDGMKISRKHNYGITHDQYLALVKKQKNRCALCGQREHHINPYTKRRQTLAVDHDHKTNQVRALLCGDCNRALGLLRESIEVIKKAARYLQKHKRKVQW